MAFLAKRLVLAAASLVLASGCCCKESTPEKTTVAARSPETTAVAPLAATPRTEAPAAPAPRPTHLVSFDVKDCQVSEVMDMIARSSGKNIVVEPDVDAKITLSLRQISWRDAVDFVCERTKCEATTVHGVVYVTQPPLVTIQTGW